METKDLMLKMWDRLTTMAEDVSEVRTKVESIESSLAARNGYVGAQAAKLIEVDKRAADRKDIERIDSQLSEERGKWKVIVGVASMIGIAIGWAITLVSKLMAQQ